MITQDFIPHITKMLREPNLVTDNEHESIQSLIKTYPYFVPARYILAAESHKKAPFSPEMASSMQLYRGNWLLFWDFMGKAREGMVEVPIPEPQPVVVTNNIETTHEEENILIEAAHHDEAMEAYIIHDVEEIPAAETPKEENINYIVDNGQPQTEEEHVAAETEETLILPIYTEDYFLHQGIEVSNDIPNEVDDLNNPVTGVDDDEDKSLMVVMSFSEWLTHFQTQSAKAKEEEADQKALKSMWQKEKLAAALEEENEEIPENVFEMAINSITNEEDVVSESLANIYIKQGKYDKAIEMYRKLSLRNPQKNAYFARKIEEIQKEKQS